MIADFIDGFFYAYRSGAEGASHALRRENFARVGIALVILIADSIQIDCHWVDFIPPPDATLWVAENRQQDKVMGLAR